MQLTLDLDLPKIKRTRKDSDLELKRDAIKQYGILISDSVFECLRCHHYYPLACAELAHLDENGKEHRLFTISNAGYNKSLEGHACKKWNNTAQGYGSGSSPGGHTFLRALRSNGWPKEDKYPMAYLCANCHAVIGDQAESRRLAKELRIELKNVSES